MRIHTLLTSLLSYSALASSAAILRPRQSSATQIYKFTSPTSAEGIISRSNGQLLVSFFDKGEMWTVDPSTKKASKIATFPDTTCSAAITEIAPDVFAVVAGQYSFAGGAKAGSWTVFKVDFSGGGDAKTSVIKKIPESSFFNGLTTLNNETVLIGEATKGAVYSLNVRTGDYAVVIQDKALAPGGGGIPMGIDGLKYANSTLYFTNISKNTLSKVAVDPTTGKPTGAITNVWTNTQADDMWIAGDGTVYVAASGGKIQKVGTDGKVSTLASVTSPTACAMGRTDGDKGVLYVASSNGLISKISV